MNQSGKVAFGGIVSAVCIVCMFLTGFFPFATLALPAIAGVLLIAIVIELGLRWAWLVYAAVSLLSFFLAPDAEAKLLFILFFGYYPIIKAYLERMSSRVFCWILKFLIFNAAVVAADFIALFFFQLPSDIFIIFNINLPFVFLLLGNVVFFIYDYAVTCLISSYVRKLHPILQKRFHF